MAKILVVDDNPADVTLCKYCFQQACPVPVDIVVAQDGYEALMIANRTVPDVILLDINMPRLDGLMMLEKLNIPARRIPVIILSNSDAKQDIERAYALGASAYIRKPLDYDDFVRAIESVCTLWVRSIAEIEGKSASSQP